MAGQFSLKLQYCGISPVDGTCKSKGLFAGFSMRRETFFKYYCESAVEQEMNVIIGEQNAHFHHDIHHTFDIHDEF